MPITFAQAAPILFDPPEAVTPAGTLFNSVSALVTALGSATPGDVLILANGTYNNVWIDINGVNGNPGNPIKVYAETPGQVFLEGSSQLSFINSSWVIANGFVFRNGFINENNKNTGTAASATCILPGCSWCRTTNHSMIKYENAAAVTTQGNYVSVGRKYNRADHIYCKEKTVNRNAVGLNRPDNNEPDYCVFDHFYLKDFNFVNQYEAMQFNGNIPNSGPSRNLIHHNFIDNFTGESECISVKCSENVLWGNTLNNCQGFITNRQGHRNVYNANAFIGQGRSNAGGFRITGDDHFIINNYAENLGLPFVRLHGGKTDGTVYNQARRTKLIHNTVRNVNKAFVLGAGPGTINIEDITWTNNLVDSNGNQIFDPILSYQAAEHTFLTNHLFWGSGSLGIANPGNIGDNSNPNLALINGLYRPTDSSTNIIALASKLLGIVYDFEDLVRGANPTIGCIEHSDSPGSGYTTADDVGPTYDVSGL